MHFASDSAMTPIHGRRAPISTSGQMPTTAGSANSIRRVTTNLTTTSRRQCRPHSTSSATSRPAASSGTESRLQTIFELLRQLADDRDADPSRRLAELRRRRDEIDAKIARAEAGYVDVLDSAARRDRYQQFARTARELLADFRQVEENFRLLDRQLRERIAGWDGSKGEFLDELIADRHSIAESDQGRSFRAFYDLLLSAERQVELTELLDRVHDTSDDHNAEITELDPRLARTHFDWIDASERTQRTVRLLSEQLRRFLDDQVWLENRRVFELLRSIETRVHCCCVARAPTSKCPSTTRGCRCRCRSSGRCSVRAAPPTSTTPPSKKVCPNSTSTLLDSHVYVGPSRA